MGVHFIFFLIILMTQLVAIIKEFAAMQLLSEVCGWDLFEVFTTSVTVFYQDRECLILSCAELMKSFPNPWQHPFMEILKVGHLLMRDSI